MNRIYSLSLVIPLAASFFLLVPLVAQAALYAPGATLDPACAPTDFNCGITGNASNSDITNIATEKELSQVIVAWGDSLTSGTYPSILSTLSGYAVYDGGVGGDTSAQTETRMLAATDKYSFSTIIWIGRNDVLQSIAPSITEANVASMVAALTSAGNSNYIILSITNDLDEPSGSAGYNSVAALNSYLSTTYGSHYLDLRSYLVNSALADAGLSPTTQDLTDISNDVPPTSLHADSVHFNTTGYTEIAKYIESHISLLQPSSTQPISSVSLITTQGLRALLASGLVSTMGSIDVGNSGYKQNGVTVLTASSTNSSTLVGQSAGLNLLSSGLNNTAVGYQALFTATSSDYATVVGVQALYSNTSGLYNNAFGNNALFLNTTGSQNIAFGVQALNSNTTGSDNGAFGFQTLFSNITGGANQALGRAALFSNTTGSNNVAVGYAALNHNVSATSSTAVGYRAAQGSASYNNQGGVYLGYEAGFKVGTASDYNTLIGYQSGLDVTSGNGNILIGPEVNSGGNHLITGQGNIGIGYNIIFPGGTTASNQLNIGNFIFGTGLTATSSSTTVIPTPTGNLGIGTSSPNAELEVSTSTTNTTLTAGGPMVAITNRSTTANNFEELSFRTQDLTNGSATSSAKIVGINTLHTASAISGALAFFTNNAGNPTEAARFTPAGNFGIATTSAWRTFSVNGTVSFAGLTTDSADTKVLCLTANNEVVANAGTSCITSSQRFKNTIEPLATSSGLDEVLQLNPVSFQYNADIGIPGTQVGFIAEQVNQIDPRLVVLDASSTPFTVKYENLTAVLAKAIQDIATISGTFKNNLMAWLGDTTNGIEKIFANVVEGNTIQADQQLCVKKSDGTNVCITGDQLGAVLNQSGQTPSSGGTTPTTPAPADDTSATSTATSTDNVTSSQDDSTTTDQTVTDESTTDLTPSDASTTDSATQ